jgi:hypothetical protein
VRELALLAYSKSAFLVAGAGVSTFLAVPGLEELAQDRLGVDAKRHFLRLHRLEQIGDLLLRLLRGSLLPLALGLLRVFALLVRGLG